MTFKNLSLALCSLFLISCGSSDSGPKAASSRAEKRGTQAVRAEGDSTKSAALKPGDRSWGRIYLNSDYQTGGDAQFQQQVNLLLEPQYRADEVGTVSGLNDSNLPADQKSETGIAFWGKGISLNEGFDPTKEYPLTEDIFNTATASLRVSVYRSVPDANNPGSTVIEEIPLHFNDGIKAGEDSGKLVDSVINGKEVQLIFADAFGKFSLHGIFDGEKFYGNVYFKTIALDQDDTGVLNSVVREPQYLGMFSVSTCGFFTCTN